MVNLRLTISLALTTLSSTLLMGASDAHMKIAGDFSNNPSVVSITAPVANTAPSPVDARIALPQITHAQAASASTAEDEAPSTPAAKKSDNKAQWFIAAVCTLPAVGRAAQLARQWWRRKPSPPGAPGVTSRPTEPSRNNLSARQSNDATDATPAQQDGPSLGTVQPPLPYGLRNRSGVCAHNAFFQSLMAALQSRYPALQSAARHMNPNSLMARFMNDWGSYKAGGRERPQEFTRTLGATAIDMARTGLVAPWRQFAILSGEWNRSSAASRETGEIPTVGFYLLDKNLSQTLQRDLSSPEAAAEHLREIFSVAGLENEHEFKRSLADAHAQGNDVVTFWSGRQLQATRVACRVTAPGVGRKIPGYHIPLRLAGPDEKQHYELQAVVYARFLDDISRTPTTEIPGRGLQIPQTNPIQAALLVLQCVGGRTEGCDNAIHFEAMVRHGDEWHIVNDALKYRVHTEESRPAPWTHVFRSIQHHYPGRPCAFTYRLVPGPMPHEAEPAAPAQQAPCYTLHPFVASETLNGDDGLTRSRICTRPFLDKNLQMHRSRDDDYALHPQWMENSQLNRAIWGQTAAEQQLELEMRTFLWLQEGSPLPDAPQHRKLLECTARWREQEKARKERGASA